MSANNQPTLHGVAGQPCRRNGMTVRDHHMNRFFWTHDKDVQLTQRYVAGEAAGQIATMLGCTTQAVRTRCNTLGIVRRSIRADRPEHGNAAFILRREQREIAVINESDAALRLGDDEKNS